MPTLKESVADFLAQKRIAVAGVSRRGGAVGNIVYSKLKKAGYEVVALNPNAETIEGDPCYPTLQAVPGGVDGVFIATTPPVTEQIVEACAEAGINRVWIHRSFGEGSLSDKAVTYCRAHNISVIPGGCPMMFCEPVDVAHKCMRWFLNMTGGLPK